MLTSKTHGILDYITVLVFALAPSLLSFSQTGTTIAYLLAGIHLTMTVLTAFSPGMIRIIPFQVHGYVEYAVGTLLLIAPWLITGLFTPAERYFFSVAGGVILVVAFLTIYRSPLRD